MTNVDFATIEMNGRNQPVIVPANFENDPIIYPIGGRERLTQFGEIFEFGALRDLEPTQKGCLAFGIFLPKLRKRFTRDDVHKYIISQIEINNGFVANLFLDSRQQSIAH